MPDMFWSFAERFVTLAAPTHPNGHTERDCRGQRRHAVWRSRRSLDVASDVRDPLEHALSITYRYSLDTRYDASERGSDAHVLARDLAAAVVTVPFDQRVETESSHDRRPSSI